MTTNQTVSELILQAISADDRSMTWTAEKAGISPVTFSRKLRRGGGDISISELSRIADALRVSPLDFIPDSEFSEPRAA